MDVAFRESRGPKTWTCPLPPQGYEPMNDKPLRFVTQAEAQVDQLPWGPHSWLCRPGLVEAERLLLVRVATR